MPVSLERVTLPNSRRYAANWQQGLRWGAAAASIVCCASHSLSVEKSPFTVADSITATRLHDPDTTFNPETSRFNYSPDGRSVAIVLRKGSLETGSNEFSLVVLQVEEVLRFINAPQKQELPALHILYRVQTPDQKPGIDRVRWLLSRNELAFIARTDDGTRQAYILDVPTRKLRQLTHHPSDVAAFDYAAEEGVVVYSASVAPDWSARPRDGYAVDAVSVEELVVRDSRDLYPDLRYFILHLGTGQVRDVQMLLGYLPDHISIGPRAKWAVTTTVVRDVPTAWIAYDDIGARFDKELRQEGLVAAAKHQDISHVVDDDVFGLPDPLLTQFQLIDLDKGRARPLMSSPASIKVPIEVHWDKGGTSVVVASTFMPLWDAKSTEVELRRDTAAIVEVNLETRQYQPIMWLKDSAEKHFWLSLKSIRRPSGNYLIVDQELNTVEGRVRELRREFRKRDGVWSEIASGGADSSDSSHDRLELRVQQSVNSPPEIVAKDLETARERTITDLNPQLRSFTLGTIESFQWTDRLGRSFTGGLLFPPGYVEGRTYPLVIQTYGFSPREFLMDGPGGMTTAYAARAIVNRGILVLQLPIVVDSQPAGTSTRSKRFEDVGENPRFVAKLDGAIDALSKRRLIDLERMGIIGFSREGMHVHYALAFSRYSFAAATVADSAAATPWGYAVMYGAPRPGMREWEEGGLIGAPFWGAGTELWQERSPVFHLERLRTPLRYEHLGTYVPAHWDTFALLKRHKRPVELIHIPNGSHQLESPRTRFTSQQGNVDWFAFWLTGAVDPDPKKADQYRRWNKLRIQHEAHIRQLTSSLSKSPTT